MIYAVCNEKYFLVLHQLSFSGKLPLLIVFAYSDDMMDTMEYLVTLAQLFSQHPLFLTGLLLLTGYLAGKCAMLVRLPEISGFIVVGILFGHVGDLVTQDMEALLHVLTEVAIGFLALTIGGELAAHRLRRIGRDVLMITLTGIFFTFVLVLVGCSLLGYFMPMLHMHYPYAILLAAVACATSPAIIVAEIHHMRAHGRFVDYLFGLVALGDAVTVVLFGAAFSIVMNMLGTDAGEAVWGQSLREIVLALLIGGLCAFPLSLLIARVRSSNELMIITVGFVFVVTGLALSLDLSPLLINLVMGGVLVNLRRSNNRILYALEPFTPPIYALFFVIAGLEIDLAVLTHPVGLLAGTAYILFRGIGRSVGCGLGTWLIGKGWRMGTYLGTCTYSKGGVALGFVLLIRTSPLMDAVRAQAVVYEHLDHLVTIVLFSIFANELLSPLFLRYAVQHGSALEVE